VKKVLAIIVIIIILILIFGAVYYIFDSSGRNHAGGGQTSLNGFSPLNSNNPVKNENQSNFGGEGVYQEATTSPAAAPAYVPPAAEPAEPSEPTQVPIESEPVQSQPEQGGYFTSFTAAENESPTYDTAFATITTPENSNVYAAPDYSYPVLPAQTYTYTVPGSTTATTESSSNQSSSGLTNQKLENIDEQVFGVVSGLGWTQLLGGVGKEIYHTLYTLISPSGASFATIGNVIGPAVLGNGGGSSGGGGAAGGGGGFSGGGSIGGGSGATQNFGGKVTEVTYCTCEAAILLNINDVRGNQLQLLYSSAVSKLFANYDVYGTGQEVLGTYTNGGSCLVYSGEECNTEGNPNGTILLIGTSAGS
jgi:hypothetical protein